MSVKKDATWMFDRRVPGEGAMTVAEKILRHSQGGFDHDLADGTIGFILESLNIGAQLLKQECQRLMTLPVEERKDVDIQKLAGMLVKSTRSIDDLARLRAFAEGKPDSRPDHINSLLQGLTDKQIDMVHAWVEENQRMAKAVEINP